MTEVNTNSASVNEVGEVSLEQVIAWVEAQAKKCDMDDITARLRITSLRQLAEFIAPDEPNDATSMLSAIPRLRERWARKNQGAKASTAQSYASRAKSAIEEYLRWSEAPDRYDPKKPKRTEASETTAPPRKKVAPKVEAEEVVAPPTPKATIDPAELRSCTLGQGRDLFRYILPADGLKVADVRRLLYHLGSQCDDFDPSIPITQALALT